MVAIVLTKYTTQDRLDKAMNMLKFYAKAPLTYIFINETIADSISIDQDLLMLSLDDGATRCADLMKVIPSVRALLAQAKDTIKMFEEAEVRPNFYKYDADQSGTIDRQELKNCLNDLGYTLNDQEIEEAYQNLDVNGDGVIDYNEFRVWYLNGQQSFSAARKTFTKFAGSLGFLKNQGVSDALKKAKRLKKQKVQVTFNDPIDPNDSI